MSGSFHEVLFPTDISYGSKGGPKFKTDIFTADSGFEKRNIDWSQIRAEYEVEHGIKSQAQMDRLTAFFYARRGRAYAFRFKDWNDFRLSAQTIGFGDGSTTEFQIVKSYTSAQLQSNQAWGYTRKITKPVWGTIAGVTVGGVVKTSPADYTVDYTTGKITFVAAPAAGAEIIIGAGEFHIPVRFDTDHLDTTHEFWMTQSWPNIGLIEDRDWDALWVTEAPPEEPPSGATPLVSLDFKNGVYTVSGGSIALSSFITNVGRVTPGVGLVMTDGSAIEPIHGAVLTQLLLANYTIVVDMERSNDGDTGQFSPLVVQNDDDSHEFNIRLGSTITPNVVSSVWDYNDASYREADFPTAIPYSGGSIQMKVAVTRTTTDPLAISTNGGAVATDSTAFSGDFTLTKAYFGGYEGFGIFLTYTIKSVTIYEPQSDDALPALSAF
jgi:uncharacterized protein (TIGR02217 family)